VEAANQDLKNLESREQEIERLKRSVNKMQKENVQIKNDSRKIGNITAKPLTGGSFGPTAMARKSGSNQVMKPSGSPINKRKE